MLITRLAGSPPVRGLLALAALTCGLLPGVAGASPRAAAPTFAFADGSFDLLWTRTDAGVAAHSVDRSWIWGPAPGVSGLEAYAEAPDGSGQRLVQYWDKGRMEVNNPTADASAAWFVTSGLLTVELMTGRVQTRATQPSPSAAPAQVPIAGDTEDAAAPTYASFLNVSNTPRGEHRRPDRRGPGRYRRDRPRRHDLDRCRQEPAIRACASPTTKPDGPQYPRDLHELPHSDAARSTVAGPPRTKPLFDPWVFTMGHADLRPLLGHGQGGRAAAGSADPGL